MAKARIKIPSIYDAGKYLTGDNLLPIYYFSGTDLHTIDNAVKAVTKAVEPFISSEFDKEVISADKNFSAQQLMDMALAFPFGSEKKLLIVKNFDKVNDRKLFANYIKDPAEFTTVILTQNGKVTAAASEPYKSLRARNYIFEAQELKGSGLVRWVVKHSSDLGLTISKENAEYLMDIVGEDKSLLQMQLHKISDYLNSKGDISKEVIDQHASETKEFTIFQLQDALGKGDKADSLKIIYNLIDNGKDIAFINTILIKFITTIAKSLELSREGLNEFQAASKAGVNPYYYKNCMKARYLLVEKKLIKAAKAVYNAEIRYKTSSADSYTIAAILIGEILE